MATHDPVAGGVPAPSWWRSLAVNLLLRTTARRHRVPIRWFWEALRLRTRSWPQPITTRIHGRPVVINANYSYPLCSRTYPAFNNPLLEVVHQTFRAAGRPLHLVDVGAAVGDTVLFVDANCPGMVADYTCIDGDSEFFRYLTHNVGGMPNCRCVQALLSSARADAPSLVRTHGGTASAQGGERVAAQPLDDVLNGSAPVDVLKIDVDGFDGEVLAGAASTLGTHQPAVIFEWHPKLCVQTGNDAFRAFTALAAAGYPRLIWFTKYGHFSHYTSTNDEVTHHRWAQHCLNTTTDADCHFDIVAVPPGRGLSEQALADLQFAVRKPSPW